jgi:hypothetical protein
MYKVFRSENHFGGEKSVNISESSESRFGNRWQHMPSAFGVALLVAALMALLAINPPCAFAQSTMGTITGVVKDSTGALVPGIRVVARNIATGVQMETETSATGNYVILNLPVGRYEVTVSTTGFKVWSRSDIALSSNQTVRVDVTLEVGDISERVTITAAPPALQTETTDVSTTMERKLVETMPLPIAGIGGGMRNAFSIMMMMPQVKSGSGESAWDDFQVGGGQQHDWNVSVDGLSVEMGWRNHVGYMNRLTPPIDAVEEFRIDTAAFKAEDSRVSGGNIVIVTKSGTNELHGSMFDYYQSQRFNANTWLNNKRGRERPVFHRNDFGATLGGPIFLPRLYNGRDKSYFYITYEGYRFPQTSGVSELTIPLPEMRRGDFSNWVQPNGTLIPIYDPITTASDGKGGFTRQVFPGNKIPVSQLSPLAVNIAQYFPDPNAPGVDRNFFTTGTAPRKRIENAFSTKLDHSFGIKNRLAFTYSTNRYYWNNYYDSDPNDPNNWPRLAYPIASGGGRLYDRGDQYYGHVFRLNDTHMFTPTLVNTLTVGFHRLTHPEHDVTARKENWGEKLGGIANNPYWNAHFPGVRFSTDNYYGWESTKHWDEYHNVYGLDESLNWIRSNHSFKFGYSYQLLMLNRDNHNAAAGDVWFHRLGTARPLDNTGNSGSSFASFMLGIVHNGGFSVPNATLMRWPYHAFFVQDDWKITPRLTANLGFRFEANMAVYEKHDRFSYFDANLPNPGADGVPGALRFIGEGAGRDGRRTYYPAAKGYGPRAGVAYQLTPSTVVRAGAGMFFSPVKLSGSTTGFTASPGWSTPDQGVSPAFQWDQGFPAWIAPPFIDPSFNVGFGVRWDQQDDLAKLPTNATWNLAISRELPQGLVLDLTYTGSKGTYLASERVNYMQIHPQYAQLGSLLNKRIDDPEVVALGFTPPFPSFTTVMSVRPTLGQTLRMFPQYTSVGTGGMQNHSGNSTYHALILKATKRYSSGLSLVGSYVWSKLLTDADSAEPWIAGVVGAGVGAGAAQDHYNRRTEKSYGVLDYPNHFKVTASYDLPFGRGQRFVSEGLWSHIVGNWNLATFVLAQSGYPMGVVDTAYPNNLFAGTARPNVLTHDWRAPVSGERFDPDKDVFFDRSAFARRTNPSLDPFGSAPRFVGTTRMFGLVRENVSVTRTFPLHRERVNLDLRWEVYDLFNHKTWSRPASMDLSNITQFGVITGADGNRTMQFSLKLRF